MGADAFGRAPVGTGPMMFKEWVSGDRIELTGFEQYWGEKPAFDNMIIRIILEASSRTVELETGGVDIAFQISPVDWSRLEENPDTQMLTGNSMGMTYLCFNNSNELYGNELVRKAIAYAINVEAVAKTAYQARLMPPMALWPEASPAIRKSVLGNTTPKRARNCSSKPVTKTALK